MGKIEQAKEQTVGYFKGVYHEMQKVVWPSRQKALRDSATVLVFSAIIAALLAGFDFAFAWGLERLLQVFHK